MHAVITLSIQYGQKYKAVRVQGPGPFDRRFATNDPVKDFSDAVDHAMGLSQEFRIPIMASSTLEHFVNDIRGFHWDDSDMLVREH